MALQGDGKIVAVGGGDAGGGNLDFAIARYNSNGSLDTSFSGDGKLTTDFGGSEVANGVALQGGGKIVAVGVSGTGSFALARYNPNGSLDPSFSGDGRQTTDFGDDDVATGAAIQGDGKIVVVGGGGGGDDFALARYNPNGTLDLTFSGDGKQTTDLGGEDKANTVALQANGKIIAVGEGGNGDFALARYNPTGTLDTSFSGDGKQTTPFAGHDEAQGVAIQEDGKIVVVGHGSSPSPATTPTVRWTRASRATASGRRQTSATSAPQTRRRWRFRMTARSSSSAPLLGPCSTRTSPSPATTRRHARYELQRGWQAAGQFRWVTTRLMGRDSGRRQDRRGRLRIRTVTGASRVPSFATTRTARSIRCFGDGKLTTDFGDWSGVAIQGDGKIVTVGGADGGATSFDFALARYNSDGSLDTSFSGDGKQTTDFGGTDVASGVAIQGDGKIVAVGEAEPERQRRRRSRLARYNPNGSLDTSFSGDGKQTTDFGFGG